MLDTLSGTITAVKEKHITVSAGGIGFAVAVPSAGNFLTNATVQLYMYFHWNADHGPSLYGFASELERRLFLLIIDCPKIGPALALNILTQLTTQQFIEIITTGNQAGLSALQGIGTKKAEQIIVDLKHKIQKMLNNGELVIEAGQGFAQWQQLSEVLSSLNYTKPEISSVTHYLAEKYAGHNYPLDQLIRSALAFLSQKQG